MSKPAKSSKSLIKPLFFPALLAVVVYFENTGLKYLLNLLITVVFLILVIGTPIILYRYQLLKDEFPVEFKKAILASKINENGPVYRFYVQLIMAAMVAALFAFNMPVLGTMYLIMIVCTFAMRSYVLNSRAALMKEEA